MPSYLLPSANIKQIADNQRTWIKQTYLDDPGIQTFRAWPDVRCAFWQQDYLIDALSLGAIWYPDEWGGIYLWSLYSTIQRTNGKSGWPPAYQSAYFVNLFSDTANQQPGKTYYPDWASLWKAWSENQIAGTDAYGANGYVDQTDVDALTKDPYNGGQYIKPNPYVLKVRAVLAWAVYLDRNKFLDVSTTYPELEQCYATQDAMVKGANWNQMQNRWAIAIAPEPVTVITISPVTAPPQTPLPTPTDAPDTSIFDKPGVLNLVTDQDEVLIDLTGKIPAGTGQLLFNLQGNGDTGVTVIWPDTASYNIKAQPDTPKGGKAWEESHASGDQFVLYKCGTSLIFNGTQIGTPQADPPPPPTQEPPMADPLQPVKDEVTVIETSVANLLTRLNTLAANATAAGTQVDPAEITALVAEMQQKIQAPIDGAAPLPAA